ncbi:MAG: hypothetical protein ACYCU7_06845 [Acidimicrobiales bacterium]
MSAGTPGALAVFYGWPSHVNGAGGDPAAASSSFARFEVVVLGAATPTAAGDPAAAAVAGRLGGRTRLYGYVSLGRGTGQPAWSPPELGRRLGAWSEWGVGGILLDCAGRDYGVDADRLAMAVGAAHRLELDVVVNAWDPADLVASGACFEPGDAYLAENDVVRHGALRRPGDYAGRLAAVERVRRTLGVGVWATATTSRWWVPGSYGPATPRRIGRAWTAAGARPPDLLALADPLYGASSNRLPLPERPRPGRGADATVGRPADDVRGAVWQPTETAISG